jgi:glycosyltransferase EpsF
MNAKQARIAKRVCHAHLDHSFDKNPRTALKLGLARALAPHYATDLCACSESAARSVFGQRVFRGGKVNLINNGIDTSLYSTGVSEVFRSALTGELGIKGKRVVLHVARLSEVKNHTFVLEMASAAKECGLPWVFLCAGAGPLLEQIRNECAQRGLSDYVKLLGTRSDVPLLMQMADVLILPSFMEGFPVVLVEAHAAGVPMVASPAVTQASDMGLDILRILPIDKGVGGWLDAISLFMKKPRLSSSVCAAQVENFGFGVKHTAQQLMRVYGIV